MPILAIRPSTRSFFNLRKWVFCDGPHRQTNTQTNIATLWLNRPMCADSCTAKMNSPFLGTFDTFWHFWGTVDTFWQINAWGGDYIQTNIQTYKRTSQLLYCENVRPKLSFGHTRSICLSLLDSLGLRDLGQYGSSCNKQVITGNAGNYLKFWI